MTKTQSTRTTRTQTTNSKAKAVWWVVGGVVGLGLIVLLAVSIASEQPVDASIGYGEVNIEGDPLPFLADPTADVAVGLQAPTVTGHDWNGVESSIAPDGRPKVIIFLAHWCPHCQAEVPRVQAWIDAGSKPADVDFYAFTVATDRLRPNWPPQEWLIEEGWTAPVIMDDEIGTLAAAFGMTGTPFYVVLDGENRVVQRVSGEIGTAGVATLFEIAQTG